MEIKLALGECSGSFDMEKAVCNHGLFMMSPNVWIPSTKSLRRPLRLADLNRSVLVTISHPPNQSFLVIQVDASLSPPLLMKQLYCWKRTLDMAKALCNLQREIALDNGKARCKRKRSTKKRRSSKPSECIANFPTWKELVRWARVDAQCLEERCNIGYRAAPILRLALMFANGKLDEDEITKLEQSSDPTAFQSLIPSDTETIRHLKQVHGKGNCSNNTIARDVEEIYGQYDPFQCLAYWMELVEEYESNLGN
ncbi:hypothetical protein F3Y22_tig00014732pilonHSYRG00037 [Hibiscus syriacus]|uniref:Uncharacterized protein n=1 Tax=Hibiscus syriacus TaxID=106335 RepID=A0A6A3BZ31_HIBSY|nr:hypothetical protein F3Y22_tig00014732pilonHSYRG00037 [Hibiscus syriacus]